MRRFRAFSLFFKLEGDPGRRAGRFLPYFRRSNARTRHSRANEGGKLKTVIQKARPRPGKKQSSSFARFQICARPTVSLSLRKEKKDSSTSSRGNPICPPKVKEKPFPSCPRASLNHIERTRLSQRRAPPQPRAPPTAAASATTRAAAFSEPTAGEVGAETIGFLFFVLSWPAALLS